MNELDRKIREALPPIEAELLGPPDEPSMWKEVKQLFQGKLWWISLVVAVAVAAFTLFMVLSVVYFFQAQTEKEMLAWAGAFGFSLIAVSFSRLWFWLILHRNAVVREVKRVELLVARLSSRLQRPA
jgi:hypothetical protein